MVAVDRLDVHPDVEASTGVGEEGDSTELGTVRVPHVPDLARLLTGNPNGGDSVLRLLERGSTLVDVGEETRTPDFPDHVSEVPADRLTGGRTGTVIAVELEPRCPMEGTEGVAQSLNDPLGAVLQLVEHRDVDVHVLRRTEQTTPDRPVEVNLDEPIGHTSRLAEVDGLSLDHADGHCRPFS